MRSLWSRVWIVLFALATGFVLWLHVATEKLYVSDLTLPVVRVDVSSPFVLASMPPDSVRVTVMARGKQLLRAAWKGHGVRINAARLGHGLHDIPLTLENVSLTDLSGSVQLQDIKSPTMVSLNLDHQVRVPVNVVSGLITTADDGFAVGRTIELEPERALLTGPKTHVSNAATVYTAPRELAGLRTSVTLTVPLQLPPGYGLRVEPESVKVTIPVVPVRTRTYSDIPVVVFNTPSGTTVATSPARLQVEITGPPEDIELLHKNALTAFVDYRARTALGMAPVRVDCPANFKVKRTSADSVRVMVNRSADAGD